MRSDLDNIEYALESLERKIDSNLRELWKMQHTVFKTLSDIQKDIQELQKLHKIDNQEMPPGANKLLQDTYNKHQFAKKLILGETDGQ